VNTYPIICTELCGLGHSLMRSRIEVMTKANYDKWYSTGGRKAGQDPGLAVFNQFGCGGCHTFKAASAGGKVGPDLDKLKEEAATAKKPLEDFIRESIEDPNAYVQPGYSPGVMPPFADQIQPKDLDALVKFLAENAQ
jgi:cytochrome c oxidase subunit 2